jgi:hypothetical protein
LVQGAAKALETAKALGFAVSLTLLARADEVIGAPTSDDGTSLPRTSAMARPQLVKADTAFQAHLLVNRLNLA